MASHSRFLDPKNSGLLRQFIRYVLVGGVAFLIDFATLFALTHYAGWHYLASASTGFLLGLLVNYLLCVWWIFDFRSIANRGHEFLLFAAVGGVGLILNNGLIFAFTEWGQLHYLISKGIAAALILIFNFSLRRALLFTRRGQDDLAHPARSDVTAPIISK